jgi:hypothetical protein
MNNRIVINSSVDDLVNDIRATRDPIRRTILKKFLVIKMNQMRSEAEDPSLDDLSDNGDTEESINSNPNTQENKSNNQSDNQSNHRPKSNAEKELEFIMKQQKESLDELDKLSKIKAYSEMIDDNRKDKDRKDIVKKRGKTETMWQNGDVYDPKYIEYQKDDVMNNKLMERLNSEIDFRMDDPHKTKIEKPFNDTLDNLEEFARYEQTPEEEKIYKPKSKQVLGQKRPIRR